MSQTPRDMHELLDAYLDGALGAADRAAFEAAMRTDQTLGRAVEVQRAIDASLKRRFEAEAVALPLGASVSKSASHGAWDQPAEVAGRVGAGAPQRSVAGKVGFFRIAAAIVLAGVALWVMQFVRSMQTISVNPLAAYAAVVQAGFRPYEVCTDDKEFAAYTERKFGVTLVIKPVPGLELVGWSYIVKQPNDLAVVSEHTITLLARSDGKPVVVFMDKAGNDRAVPLQAGDGLNVFKREVGGVVLYEVTPFADERVAKNFVLK